MNFFLNISFPIVDEGSISNTKTPEQGRLISGKYRLFFDDLIQDISHSETSYINLDNTKFTNILTCLRIGDLSEPGAKQLTNQMIQHQPLFTQKVLEHHESKLHVYTEEYETSTKTTFEQFVQLMKMSMVNNGDSNWNERIPNTTNFDQFLLDNEYNNITNFEIPEQLSNLTISEQLLIRKVAPFIPACHIKSASLAVKGRRLTFPHDIVDVSDTFQRKQIDLTTYLRQMGNKNTGAVKLKHLHVRKEKVFNALEWLKIHNSEYKSIFFSEDGLDWMNDQEEAQMYDDENVINLHDNKTKKEHCKLRKEYPLQTGLKLLPTEIQIKVFEYLEKPDAICYGVFLGENSGIDFHKIAHEFWEIHFIKAQNMRLQWQLWHAETKIQLMETQQEELVRICSKKTTTCTRMGCKNDMPPQNWTCSGCNISKYCSKKCQRQDWQRHRRFCFLMEPYNYESDSNEEFELVD